MYNDDNYDNYDSDNDCNLDDIIDNISPPILRRQNAFIIRNRQNETSYSSDYPLNEFTDFINPFFLEQEISTENQIDTEINLYEIINRSISDELDIQSPPSLRKIQSECKESITIKSFNAPPQLTKFYSF